MSPIAHLATAIVFGALAWLLWWQAMPTMVAHRGRLQAFRVWFVGMAMACFASVHINLSYTGSPLRWDAVAGDVFMIAAAVLELLRARHIGRCRWGKPSNV